MAYYWARASVKDYYIIVIYFLTRAITFIINIGDLSLFTILKIIVLTQYNIKARRDFRADLKE